MASGIQAQPSLSAEEQGGWRGPPSSPVALEMSVCLKLLVVCVCVCVCDSSDEDWLQAAALLEATFSSVALH